MRYRGGGVGHLGTRQYNKYFLMDKHPPLGEISDMTELASELVGSKGSDSDRDSDADSESEDGDGDGGVDDIEGDLNVNDIDIVTAAGLGAL